MRFNVLLLTALSFVLGGGASAAAPGPPAGPALIADTNRAVSVARDGRAQAFRMTSAILGQTREIDAVLPASHAHASSGRLYPVTIVLDGEANVAAAAAVSGELSRNGQIPESIIVAIRNVDAPGARLHDLTPPGLSVSGSSLNEGGDRFLDFIERELLPAVDRQLRGGAPRTLIGHSSGAVLGTYAAATRSTFGAVVAIDAPIHLGEGWLAKRLTERARAAAAPLRYVSLEARFGWPEEAWATLVAAAPPSWTLHREGLGRRESHESMGMIAMYLGLREAFADYSMLAAPAAPTTSILPRYRELGAALGATLTPPRKLLANVVESLLAEGRGAAAREAWDALVAGYGPPADEARLLARIAEVERRPPPAETVETLLATPFPTPEEARPYVGEWIGDEWMSPDEPRTRRLTLRIEVVGGRVVAEVEDAPLPPPYRIRRIEHLRITPVGLTYGYMNGMQPRGVLLYEGRLEGDTLSGAMRFGGVELRGPDGSPPPLIRFSFERARSR